jgi:hypothetical protein
MCGERGQASIDWIAMVLAASLALGGLTAAVLAVDGRSLGGALAHAIVCAVRHCDDGDAALERAYGEEDARLVRRHLQGLVFERSERQLPVDWRDCREVACSEGPDEPDLDVHRTDSGLPATVFTRLHRRGGRRYVQYWFYYPDSNTSWAGSDRIWKHSPTLQRLGKLVTGSAAYPGYHRDDWEGAAIRVERDGRPSVRVTSHGHWQWCKRSWCKELWGPTNGWTRVSRGSHAGHVPLPARPPDERTTTADGIRLVPLERIDRRRYRRLDPDIAPPWLKDAYENPESSAS